MSSSKYGSAAYGLINQAPRTVNHTTSKLPPSGGLKFNRDQPDRTKLGETVPTMLQLKQKYINKMSKMSDDHEKLIEQILEDEERLIFKHNTVCKETVKTVEQEMQLLKQVD